MKAILEFGTMLPETNEFKVRYFLGKQSMKYWLMCQKDLDNINECLRKAKSVILWCDARVQKLDQQSEKVENKRKKAGDEPPCKRQQIEKDLEQICMELEEKHGNKYSIPHLRCWARLVMTEKHKSKDEIPEF